MATVSRPAGARHVVGRVEDLPPGQSMEVKVGGRSIAVFNDEGRLHALRNVCPHHGAPLCSGQVSGIMLPSDPHEYHYSGSVSEHRVVKCPWHGYEFRLADGCAVVRPETMRVKRYPVEIEGDEIALYV